ncbi:lipase (class 3) [Herbihabitans rhizosphaerae]|uniref:Lipase (Class 3) n=1 Tax=Herbihabitans rhizosphaerae TaxID=1872711 RepID=A0A4Q7KFE9_9PSEU|nr:hypothetical protein [Herbihabitans rhizosphaerae]RZS33933.1 lipase (class 3) [Herbihabitans rhizosphaerae]
MLLPPGPDTRVVELRVHGIMGTKAESLVDSVAAVEVGGDRLGRIVRPADRLRRPAPGPMLRANGRSLPRIVEGYVWGGMTSGGLAKSAWALLFPFSLANVAHWMLPPVAPNSRAATVLGLAIRSLLRIAALLLTMLLVTQVAVVSLDLLAAQCLSPGAACLSGAPDWLRETPSVRALLGLLPVLLVIFTLHRVSTACWDITGDSSLLSARKLEDRHVRGQMPGTGLAADPDTPTLRALHTVAALATVSLLPLGGPLSPPSGALPGVLWTTAMVLLVLALAGALLIDDPTGATPERGGRWLRASFGRIPRRLLIGLGVTLVIAAGASTNPLPTRLSGTDSTAELIAAAMFVVCVVFAVLLLPAALLARPMWATRPRELRPWAGGWMSAPVLGIACLLGGGFGAGLGIAVRRLIDAPGLELPRGYQSLTLLWGAGAVLTVLVATPVIGLVVLYRLRRERRGLVDPEAALLHDGRPDDLALANHAWWWARWRRAHVHHVALVTAGVLLIGSALALVMRLSNVDPPGWTEPLSGLGVLALGLLAAGLLRAVYIAVKAKETARQLGVIADLACFWPREAHPTVPPCYALKVVPELAARAREHLRDPGVRVVLTGHSQGGLLAAFAAARLMETLPPADRERVGLVTAGSQLQWAYPRAFPAVVPHTALAALAGGLDGRWRALCRGTDFLGGAVTTWQRQVCDGELLGVGYRPDGALGPLPPATRAPTGALILGGDHWLPDPLAGPFPGRRWVPGVLGHREYFADPEWDRAIALAAGLDPTEPTTDWHAGLPALRATQNGASSTTATTPRSEPADTDPSTAN